MNPITEQQQKVLDYIGGFIAEHRFPPTRIEIADHFGYKSPNAADAHVKGLVRKGYVTLRRGTARGITINNHPIEQPLVMVPSAHAEWQSLVVEASRKWVKCKGRYHSEQNMAALIELFSQEPEREA